MLVENNLALPFKDEVFNIFHDPANTIIFRNSCPHSSEGKYKDVHSSTASDQKIYKQLKWPLPEKWIKYLLYIYKMKLYSNENEWTLTVYILMDKP